MNVGRCLLLAILAGVTLSSTACGGPKAVRGGDVEGFDDEAMSTGLDRRDLQELMHKSMEALQSSAVVGRWEKEDRPTLAVLQIRNETSEHIDSALQALITDVETTLINAGHVRVISQEDQPELMAEVRRQQTDAFDQAQVSEWGRQIGARYFVTGKVYSVDERQDGERRVQYFMFLRVLSAETSEVLFQNKVSITKGLVK